MADRLNSPPNASARKGRGKGRNAVSTRIFFLLIDLTILPGQEEEIGSEIGWNGGP